MSVKHHIERLRIHLADLKKATDNFSKAHRIGGGGFGEVYKGELILDVRGQTMVAIKRLDRKYGQGDHEFWNEIILLSDYKHENIVSLLGFCDESKEKILVYEYASNRGLDLYINDSALTWPQRLTISIGAARGLAYLHGDVGNLQKVFHRDVKSSNILLDSKWNAKISDFGLSKFAPANNNISVIFTTPVGTLGYCDPLYVESSFLTKESDIYSFGVVLFEVFCGRLCIGSMNAGGNFIRLVKDSYKQQNLNDIISHHFRHKISPESMKEFTTIAYQCLRKKREERPSMNEVVEALKKALDYQLSPDKAYDSETILAQRKISLPHIFNGVLALDSSVINLDQINDFMKVLPTSEERDMLKSYMGDKEMLGERAQFVLECSKIPGIGTKLLLLKMKFTLTNQVNEITRNLNIVKEATKEIMESQKLASIMKEYDHILEQRQRGHLHGLWLNNIRKLKETDVFLLYKEGVEKEASWFDFDKDLINLDVASKINIQDLRDSKSTILKEVLKAQQELNSSASDSGVSTGVHEALKTFLDDAERHPSITYFFDDVKQDADSLLAYFKADPEHNSWTTVLGFIRAFIVLFKSQASELERERAEMREAERRRQEVAERVRKEEEFAAEPVALRVFVLLSVALVKAFDIYFRPRQRWW